MKGRCPACAGVAPRAAERAEAGAPPSPVRPAPSWPWTTWLCLTLFCALFALLGLSLAGRGPFPIGRRALSAQEKARDLRATVYFAVTAIELHRARTGRLPPDLAAVGLGKDAQWTYTLEGPSGYRIALKKWGRTFTYDSTQDPATVFAGLPSPILKR